MEKKLLIIIIAFSSLSSSLFAQKPDYSFSDEFKKVKKHRYKGFYKLNENAYAEVYLQKDEKGMAFQIFDKDFKTLRATVKVPFPEFDVPPSDEGFFRIKNNLFWFYSTWDRSSQSERLFALPFNSEKLEFASREIKLVETGRLNPYDKYHIHYSVDSTKILVRYNVKSTRKLNRLNRNIIGFSVYGPKMNKIYAHEIEMPYTEAEMDNLDYKIDSNGDVYMLTRVKVNNSIDGDITEDKDAVRYEINKIDQKSNTLQSIKISPGNKYIRSLILSEDLNHKLILAGYYSDAYNSDGTNGAYIMRLEYDQNNMARNFRTMYCKFPDGMLNKSGVIETTNLSPDKLIFYPDGNIMIIGEENYFDIGSSSSAARYTFHYNDILVLKVNKNGESLWCNKISKRQIGGRSESLSYYHHTYKGEDYFFYLDNIKNINLTLNETPALHRSGKGGYLTYVKLAANGKMNKASLFDIEQEGGVLCPSKFEPATENMLIEQLKAGGKSKIFKLELK